MVKILGVTKLYKNHLQYLSRFRDYQIAGLFSYVLQPRPRPQHYFLRLLTLGPFILTVGECKMISIHQ